MRSMVVYLVALSVGLTFAVPVSADTYDVAKVYRDYPGYINPAVCDNPNLGKPATATADIQKPTDDQTKTSESALYRIRSDNPVGAFYVGINAGATWINDADISIEGFDDVAELSYDTGYGVNLALGHAYANGLRSELEVVYRENDIDDVSSDYGDFEVSDAEVTTWGAMVNGYYDFATGTQFKPFVGAGIGYANVEYDSDDSVDDDVFAYQGMVGCGFAISQQVTLDLQYRFYATDDPEFDDKGIDVETEYMTHNAMLGLRFNF